MRIVIALLAACLLSRAACAPASGPGNRIAAIQNHPSRLNRPQLGRNRKDADKYFHESGFSPHYDGRFANQPLADQDRRNHLVALLQTYLSTMNDIGAETWIMHGSLLGWWWNRKILPWDSDLDVMVTEKSIHHLADYYNMTVHHYTLPGLADDGRDYLLEINPHYSNGSLDNYNKIDARWIDTETGLFIDITTIRRNVTAEALGVEGAMMVKDKHHYLYDDIFPLRESTFESFPVKIPFAYAEVLVEEYHEKALADTMFEGYRFDTETQEWLPLSCRDFNTCHDKYNPKASVKPPAQREDPVFGPREKPRYGPAMGRTRPGPPRKMQGRPSPPRLLNGQPYKGGRWDRASLSEGK